MHDNWNPSTTEFEGDIAILKLSGPVTLNELIMPVCIANSQTFSNLNGTVVGWGIYDDTNRPSEIPKKANIPILDDIDCLKMNPSLTKVISKDVFCAGRVGAGVCRGDSGSDYYVEQDGRFHVRGLVSSAVVKKCSESDSALYSDILKNLDFIQGVSLNLFKIF